MKKMIFITWTERRAWEKNYGKPIAALWVREAKLVDITNAHRYAKLEHKRGGDHKVHVFDYIENFAEAKAKAIEAHQREIDARAEFAQVSNDGTQREPMWTTCVTPIGTDHDGVEFD